MTSAALVLRSVTLDSTLVLTVAAPGRTLLITVEGDYELARSGATRLRTYAGDEDAILGELETVVGEAFSGLAVTATGDLILEWASEERRLRLEVPPALTLVAWQLEWGDSDGPVTRCLPGGEVDGPLPSTPLP